MIIVEAAQLVLRETGKEMSVEEIYNQIIARDLFKFGAKDPKAVLSRTIRLKSDANPKAQTVLFKSTKPGVYKLAE